MNNMPLAIDFRHGGTLPLAYFSVVSALSSVPREKRQPHNNMKPNPPPRKKKRPPKTRRLNTEGHSTHFVRDVRDILTVPTCFCIKRNIGKPNFTTHKHIPAKGAEAIANTTHPHDVCLVLFCRASVYSRFVFPLFRPASGEPEPAEQRRTLLNGCSFRRPFFLFKGRSKAHIISEHQSRRHVIIPQILGYGQMRALNG